MPDGKTPAVRARAAVCLVAGLGLGDIVFVRDAPGRRMQGRVFHVVDPDGYLIEILEAPRPQ